ncbi:MAG: hydantoinase B/oxoprolinase family protein, partial [Thermoplasmata archaeon]|nr:hydantoinase B/oxoprolinase family protein [Thermoplasmata archaeon]
GREKVEFYENEVKEYSRRLTKERLAKLPEGHYHASERIELDRQNGKRGIQKGDATIEVDIELGNGKIKVDFKGTDPELEGNLNAPRAVTLSAVYYVFKCLTGADIPTNDGCFRDIEVRIPDGCLLSPSRNRGICSGNVETSQRVVEALFSALGDALPDIIPAGSQGTMNNLIIGGRGFSYYETLGGGEGAHPWRNGESGLHTYMTNTANTPVEAIEITYPIRVLEYSLLEGSGGSGRYCGGDGIRRRIEFLGEAGKLSILSGSRRFAPAGRMGGEDGKSGRNLLIRDGIETVLSSLADVELKKGDVVVVETPGGGGWGNPEIVGNKRGQDRIEGS